MHNKDLLPSQVYFTWWQLLIALVLVLPLNIWLLRNNNLKMAELYQKVVQVDQDTGDIEKVEPHLDELRRYVLTHMNASLPQPVQLVGSYNAAVERARKEAERSGSANASIYKKAQEKCENPNVLLSVRAQCIQEYVLSNSAPGSEAQSLDLPQKERFVYSFISPTLSFDMAGLTTILSVILILLLVARLLIDFVLPWITAKLRNDPLE